MAKQKPDLVTDEPEATTLTVPEAAPLAVAKPSTYGDDAGAGLDDLTADDLQIPYLTILQKGNPQVEDGNAKRIVGAAASMFMNTVTQELYESREQGLTILAVHHEQRFLEWKPRESGGGLAGVYAPDDAFVIEARKNSKAFGKIVLPNGNSLAETYNVYVNIVTPDGDYAPILIPFGSTQIKKYKQWMTKARAVVVREEDGRRVIPPLWAHRYRLKTRLEQNAKGSWYGWDITFDGPTPESCRLTPDDALYQASRAFRDMVTSGSVKASTGNLTQDQSTSDEF